MLDQAEIHRKAVSDEVEEHREAVEQLRSNFADLPDKEGAWEDLHQLTGDEDDNVRWGAVEVLGSVFQHIPDKEQAQKDLHQRIGDKYSGVRRGATYSLGTVFPYVLDKEQAQKDLHQRTRDEYEDDADVRWLAARALGYVFQHIPDKKEAWQDLIWLTKDEDKYVQLGAVDALGSAFQHALDREEAWNDLHRLTGSEDVYVRLGAAGALGSAFQHVPDKKQVWRDLIWLTEDEDKYVRASANHSLGRAFIFEATEAEGSDDFKSELKKAIQFFERSLKEGVDSNSSSFCLPFYKSFYSLTFEKAGAEEEVQRYLADAKSASEGSENKETFLEAVENLANALSEVQKVTDFDAMKSDLNAYRQYCDRAVDLIGDASEGAPGAAQVLRRGLSIINERIREIPERAEALCRETWDTPLKELGLATSRYARELPTQYTLAMTMSLGEVAGFARDWCEYLPTDKKADVCEQLDNLTGMELSEQGATLARVFEHVQENIHLPKIQTVPIIGRAQEIVRIAVAQISFELTESFPFAVTNRDEVKTKVFSALEIAKQNGADIVCLPELCLCEEWISEIKEKYPDMIVVGGSFYKDDRNVSPVIMKSDVDIPHQSKITPSPFEDGIMGSRMIPGDRIYRYETRFGKFVVLICMDFDDLAHFFREADIDMIFCPSFNSANERFQNEAHSHVERTPSYILIANTGLHGGTSIFGQLDNKYFGALVDGGCKDAKEVESEKWTCKLCEVKKECEEVILADFNLIHKSVQKPTPSNRSKVIKSVDHIRKIPIQPDRPRI